MQDWAAWDKQIESDEAAAWAQEIERRVAAYDRGEIPSYAAEDVFAEARRFLR